MPICKNCNSRISKFDKDRCPVCGCVDPISQEASETVEITSNFTFDNNLRKGVKIKKKVTAFLFAILIPFFGTPLYYLHYVKRGLLWCLLNLVFIGSLFPLFYFVIFPNSLLYSILIPALSAYVFNIGLGLLLLFKKDYKDGRGELVR